jgi:hypothetical protein
MTDDPPGRTPSDLMSAIVTEHFVLQTAASTATSEEGSRATLYVMALSSSLVAIGFSVQTRDAFVPLVAVLLPALTVLGLFTMVRLVDTGVQTIQARTGIERIRRFYRGLAPDASVYIPAWGGTDDETAEAAAAFSIAHRTNWLVGFFTIAGMVAAINAIVVGVGIALLTIAITGRLTPIGIVLGALAALAHTVLFGRYQRRRYRTRFTQ